MLFSEVSSGLWPLFTGAVVVLLLIDLLVFHKKSETPTLKSALIWSAFWVCLALAFNFWFYQEYGLELGTEFLTGYLIELSLSIDNLFVILLIFKAFKIKSELQHRILFWGILGAIIMRGVLIIVGVDLIHHFHWIMYIFGAILLYSGVRFLFESDDEQEVKESRAVLLIKRIIPVTNQIHGNKFFVREHSILKATPLFLALIIVEITDLIFAVDSIPAVLSITQDAFVAFGSNILAILGLRSLYFVIADQVSSLKYLKPGLAVVLGFIGVKMLIVDFYKISSTTSLFVIIGILFTAGLSSWYSNKMAAKRKS